MIARCFRTPVITASVVLSAAALVTLIFQKFDVQRYADKSAAISFNRDIRPILNENCTSCHGGVKQDGDVSFIYRAEALGKGKSGRSTVVPGNPNASELIARVTSTDPEARMPYRAPPLHPQQIALLKQWITEGARWEDYWAFVPPRPQPLPPVKHADWVRRPLDRFILARLEKEGLGPSAEADKAALLRRVSFDLTGLPPTPQELSAFVADTSADAYDKQVDRLLASPHYGERWTALWLDLARYADTAGYAVDPPRSGMWVYRDWVIDAFNQNLPYDKFVVTQLAGDLLPHPTLGDRIATAFHRQTPANNEAGTDDEEFRLVALLDRVATTWSVLNGVTMNCVQCHSHPYDPIRQPEYYKFLAFFNTSQDSDASDDSPVLRVPHEKARYAEAGRLQNEIIKARRSLTELGRQATQSAQWKSMPITGASIDEISTLRAQLARLRAGQLPLEAQRMIDRTGQGDPEAIAGSTKYFLETETEAVSVGLKSAQARLADGTAPTLVIRNGEAVTAENSNPSQAIYDLTAKAEGILSAIRIEVPPVNPETASHTPEGGFVVERVDAWAVMPDGREHKIDFQYFVADSESNLHSQGAVASKFAADPSLFQTRWIVGIFTSPLNLPRGGHLKVRLTPGMTYFFSKPQVIHRVRLLRSDDPRWMTFVTRPSLIELRARLERLERQLADIPGTDVPVMSDQPQYEARQTRLFERGDFLNKTGQTLQPDVPALFPRLPDNAPRNRFTAAQWFFFPEQPLTARVAVNRYWEQLFGTGIVETLEDFGSAGQEPSHPELLDWLALHFQKDLRWDMKALLRELVTSATYRQSAVTSEALLKKDPGNRLLTRGPRQRLTAEMVRDQALLASGLLNFAIGGASVKPPLPASLITPNDSQAIWVESKGPDRYRRAVYTYLQRSAIYPSFLTFDAAAHDVSLPRRIPTNTPLQALVTLNDPVYQEAAEALGKRMMQLEHGPTDAKLAYGLQLVLSRDATPEELASLITLYESVVEISGGTLRKTATISSTTTTGREQVAFTAVASALLNLDAALVR